VLNSSQARAIFSSPNSRSANDLIVFSHLRWEFVTQRPQHLLTRLSRQRRVLFVEEPIPFTAAQRNTAKLIHPSRRITVLQPRTAGFNPQVLAQLIEEQISTLGLRQNAVWFYSPLFLDVLHYLEPPAAIIFDCMDQLSAFKGAPPQLLTQERKLLQQADLVFTGGKSLFEAKKKWNRHVYCFPSSVDSKHFQLALLKSTPIPRDIASLAQPRVGYYGVIDERIDLKLLAQAARSLPEVSFVMVGPVVKIDPAGLPQQPNLHYLGSKPYQKLPNYLKALDIAMMPFALNAATKFISPTKTLEYMAAAKPIVSTPITDVVRDYKSVVAIAKNSRQFTEAIRKLLEESSAAHKQRQAAYRKILSQTSWDQTAASMDRLINQAINRRAHG
jgi:glycosyltransferase involved in cell wall biosynthesis